MPKVFPEEPENYSFIEDRTNYGDGEFVAPEDGWYQLDAISKSGNGAMATTSGSTSRCGSSGGSGAIARKSKIKLNKGERIPFSINSDILINDATHDIRIKVIGATDGVGQYNPGRGGTATGGDVNINGYSGSAGNTESGAAAGPTGPSTPNDYGFTIKGGDGGGTYYFEGSSHPTPSGTYASNASLIRFYRGNTNLPLDQLNAQNITGLMLEMSQLAQEQTSMLINTDVSH